MYRLRRLLQRLPRQSHNNKKQDRHHSEKRLYSLFLLSGILPQGSYEGASYSCSKAARSRKQKMIYRQYPPTVMSADKNKGKFL